MEIYPKLIMDALATVRYPGTGKNIVEAGMVEDDLRISGLHVSFSLIFDKPTNPFLKSLVKASEAAIHAYVGKEVEVEIHTKTLQAPRPEVGQLLPGVKNIIAVSSGKGGVGKSTVAANLAVGLSKLGYKVGLLDADVFGPSMPKMFHVEDAHPYAESVDGRDLIVPVESYGIKMLSIGFFVDPDQATLWRGAMACNALKQLTWITSSSTRLRVRAISISRWCRPCLLPVPSLSARRRKWRWPMHAKASTCTRTRK